MSDKLNYIKGNCLICIGLSKKNEEIPYNVYRNGLRETYSRKWYPLNLNTVMSTLHQIDVNAILIMHTTIFDYHDKIT